MYQLIRYYKGLLNDCRSKSCVCCNCYQYELRLPQAFIDALPHSVRKGTEDSLILIIIVGNTLNHSIFQMDLGQSGWLRMVMPAVISDT